jgi:hypothetical protein
VRDGSVAETWTDTNSADAGHALAKNWRGENGTAEMDASASASPVALLSCNVIGDPTAG